MELYSTSQAAKIAGIASSSARNYTRDPRLAPFFSRSAAPTSSKTARQFTPSDVNVLRYIGERTRAGATLDDVAAALQSGELDAAQEGPQQATASHSEPQQQTPEQTMALVALSVLQQQHSELLAALQDAERRAATAEAEAAAARAQLASLQEQQQRKGFWARLFKKPTG